MTEEFLCSIRTISPMTDYGTKAQACLNRASELEKKIERNDCIQNRLMIIPPTASASFIYLGIQFNSPIFASIGGLSLVGSLIFDTYVLVNRYREEKRRKNRNYVINYWS